MQIGNHSKSWNQRIRGILNRIRRIRPTYEDHYDPETDLSDPIMLEHWIILRDLRIKQDKMFQNISTLKTRYNLP